MVLYASFVRPDASTPSAAAASGSADAGPQHALRPSKLQAPSRAQVRAPLPPGAVSAVEAALRDAEGVGEGDATLGARVRDLLHHAASEPVPTAALVVLRLNEAVEALSPTEAQALLGQQTVVHCHQSLAEVTGKVFAPGGKKHGTVGHDVRERLVRLWGALTKRHHALPHLPRPPDVVPQLLAARGQDVVARRPLTPLQPAQPTLLDRAPRGRAPHKPVATPAGRAVSPLPATKVRPLDAETCRAQGLNPKYALLRGDSGRFVMGRSRLRGTFGKVHLALSLDDEMKPLAIKELRLLPKPGVDRLWRAAKTSPTQPARVNFEYVVQQRVREAARRHLQQTYADISPIGQALWHRYVPAYVPSETRGVIFDFAHASKDGVLAPKAYLISSLAFGDAGGLVDTLDAVPLTRMGLSVRRTLARSFAMQLFAELHVMHVHARFAHLDIKLENVQLGASGNFMLGDFGLAQPVTAKGDTGQCGKSGAVGAPEMLVAQPGARGGPAVSLCTKTDVFALAATCLQVLAGADCPSPFEWRYSSDASHIDEEATAATFGSFFRAAELLPRNKHGEPTLLRDVRGNHRFPETGDPHVDVFFARACERDWELTECMLALGLRRRIEERGHASTLARASADLLGRLAPSAADRLLATLAEELRDGSREAELLGLKRYAEAVRHDEVRRAPAA